MNVYLKTRHIQENITVSQFTWNCTLIRPEDAIKATKRNQKWKCENVKCELLKNTQRIQEWQKIFHKNWQKTVLKIKSPKSIKSIQSDAVELAETAGAF